MGCYCVGWFFITKGFAMGADGYVNSGQFLWFFALLIWLPVYYVGCLRAARINLNSAVGQLFVAGVALVMMMFANMLISMGTFQKLQEQQQKAAVTRLAIML